MPVLCYHSVDSAWASPLAIDSDEFARQCAWLTRHRQVIPAESLVPVLAQGHRPPPRTVAMTFDDGFEGLYHHAFSPLVRNRLPAMVFLVARTLDGGPTHADWLRPQPAVAPSTLTREQVLEMQAAGITFGSHSYAHHDLTQLTEAECVRDLRESREVLEELLRQPVGLVAYPYGLHAPHVRRAAERAGYDYALSLPEEHEPRDRFAVPRVGIYRRNQITTLRVKSTRWYATARTSRIYTLARTTGGALTARSRTSPAVGTPGST